MKPRMKSMFLLVLISALVLVAACSSSSSSSTSGTPGESNGQVKDISLRLDYVLSGYHAPFYVALEKGYYIDVGLNVTIGEGKGSGASIQSVDNGSDTFAYADGGTMMNYVSQGAKIKAVAGIFQKNPGAVIFKKDGKINSPQDLDGLRIGGAPGGATESLYPAFLQEVGVDPDKNMIANLESSSKLTALIDGQVDGVLSFGFLQTPILEENNIEADTLLFADYGINTPGLSIITTQKMIDNEPDTVKNFLAATQKGFEDSIANPKEAIAIMKELFPELVIEDMFEKVLVGSFPLMNSENTEGKPFGYMSEKDWELGEDLIDKFIGLHKKSGAQAYFTNDFISIE